MADKISIDACPRLDAFMLYRRGALTDGAITKWEWPLPIGSTVVVARTEGERLFFAVNGRAEVACSIARTPGTLGNFYAFFGCSCERSARYLYVLGDRIACRSCHKLVYPTRMPGQGSVAQRRLNRARARLLALEIEALALRRNKERLKFVRRSIQGGP